MAYDHGLQFVNGDLHLAATRSHASRRVLGQSTDDLGRHAFLRRTLEPICAPEGDRTHPPGRERVEGVVAQPTVAAALSCDAPDVARAPSGTPSR